MQIKNKQLSLYLSLIVVSLMALFFFPQTINAAPTFPAATSNYYVDDAKILSSTTEQFIQSVNNNYQQTTEKPQIAVAAVKNMQGLTREDYANQLFEKWQIGNKKLDNGVLILFSLEERQIWIEVGYGLEGALTDSGTGAILDRNIDLLKADKFDEALKSIFTEVAVKINGEYDFKNEEIFSGYEVDAEKYSDSDDSGILSVFILIGIIVVVSIFFGGGGSNGPGGRRRRGNISPLLFGLSSGIFRGGSGSGGSGGFGGGGSFGGGGAGRSF